MNLNASLVLMFTSDTNVGLLFHATDLILNSVIHYFPLQLMSIVNYSQCIDHRVLDPNIFQTWGHITVYHQLAGLTILKFSNLSVLSFRQSESQLFSQ